MVEAVGANAALGTTVLETEGASPTWRTRDVDDDPTPFPPHLSASLPAASRTSTLDVHHSAMQTPTQAFPFTAVASPCGSGRPPSRHTWLPTRGVDARCTPWRKLSPSLARRLGASRAAEGGGLPESTSPSPAPAPSVQQPPRPRTVEPGELPYHRASHQHPGRPRSRLKSAVDLPEGPARPGSSAGCAGGGIVFNPSDCITPRAPLPRPLEPGTRTPSLVPTPSAEAAAMVAAFGYFPELHWLTDHATPEATPPGDIRVSMYRPQRSEQRSEAVQEEESTVRHVLARGFCEQLMAGPAFAARPRPAAGSARGPPLGWPELEGRPAARKLSAAAHRCAPHGSGRLVFRTPSAHTKIEAN